LHRWRRYTALPRREARRRIAARFLVSAMCAPHDEPSLARILTSTWTSSAMCAGPGQIPSAVPLVRCVLAARLPCAQLLCCAEPPPVIFVNFPDPACVQRVHLQIRNRLGDMEKGPVPNSRPLAAPSEDHPNRTAAAFYALGSGTLRPRARSWSTALARASASPLA
jgi:hypothetical protein